MTSPDPWRKMTAPLRLFSPQREAIGLKLPLSTLGPKGCDESRRQGVKARKFIIQITKNLKDPSDWDTTYRELEIGVFETFIVPFIGPIDAYTCKKITHTTSD